MAVASGTAGFVWQGLWNIQFATVLGHEWMAVLGVTAAMFLGMALGAGVMAPAIKSVRQVGMLYAAFELGIGVWGMFTLFMSPFMISYASRLLGEQPSRLEHVPC
ncbi:MAG: spermidine synthase, partial [Betaproteobacteria bacterium]|nr:spermidine synthase [Betaproteobacteria bacterium]